MPSFFLRHFAFAFGLAIATPVSSPASVLDLLQQVPTSNSTLQEALDAIAMGHTGRARALVQPVLALNPDLAAAHEILGVIEAAEGAIDPAIASFKRAVELNPGQGTAVTKLGDVYSAIGDRASARHYYLRALTILPDDRLTHQRLGLMAEEDGDIGAAIRHFEAGIQGTPQDYLGVKLNLALLYNLTGAYDKTIEMLAPLAEETRPALLHRALANARLGQGDTADAIVHYKLALARDPDDLASRLGLGIALTKAEDIEAAIAELSTLNVADPTDPDVAIALARAYIAANDIPTGIKVLDATLSADAPAPMQLLIEAAGMHMAEGDYAAAEARWHIARDHHPEAVAGYLGLGSLLGFQLRYEEASDVLAEGLVLAPDHPGMLRAAMRASQQLGQQSQALEHANRLSETGVAQPQDLFIKAALEESVGAPDAAIATYHDLIAAAPEFWPALNNLAVLLTDAGDFSEALDMATVAHALAPKNAAVTHTLGRALFHAGDAEAAATMLEQAVALAPENTSYLAHLAEVELALGHVEAARATLKRARASGLDEVTATELEARIGG